MMLATEVGNFLGDINAIATLAGDAAFLCLAGEAFTWAAPAAITFLFTLMGVTRVFRGLTKPSSSRRLRCTDALLLLDFFLIIGGVTVLGVLGVFGNCKNK